MIKQEILKEVEKKLWDIYREVMNTYGEGIRYSRIENIIKFLDENITEKCLFCKEK